METEEEERPEDVTISIKPHDSFITVKWEINDKTEEDITDGN